MSADGEAATSLAKSMWLKLIGINTVVFVLLFSLLPSPGASWRPSGDDSAGVRALAFDADPANETPAGGAAAPTDGGSDPTVSGRDGRIGAQGLQGLQGPQGPPGPPGPPGPAGPRGEAGLNASSAGVGAVGPRGEPGDDGAVGPVGPQGEPGPAGVPGPVGPTGPEGEPGRAGTPGPAGPRGEAGRDGAAGPVGPQGEAGPPGPPGPPGQDDPSDRSVVGTLRQRLENSPRIDRDGTVEFLLNGQTIPSAKTAYPALWERVPVAWKSGADLLLPDMVSESRGLVAAGGTVGLGVTADDATAVNGLRDTGHNHPTKRFVTIDGGTWLSAYGGTGSYPYDSGTGTSSAILAGDAETEINRLGVGIYLVADVHS